MSTVFIVNGKELSPEEWQKNVRERSRLNEFENNGRPPGGPPTKGWPLHCDGLGCHPSQVKEMTEFYAKKGVKVRFDKQCRMILDSRQHRNEVLKAGDHIDRDAGYGDYAGK